MNPLVSIIIPVYNVENYLKECFDSIIAQSYKNYEVIIVNDGSTDSSEEIIFKYKKKFKKLIYIYQENFGVAAARQEALKYINGKYTMFLDPDDFLDLNCISKIVTKAEETESDMIIYGYNVFSDKNISYKKQYFEFNCNKEYEGKTAAELFLKRKITAHLWNKLFLSENLRKNDMTFDIGRESEDWYPTFIQIVKAKKIIVLNEGLYYYRQRPGSSVQTCTLKKIDDYWYATSKILNFLNRTTIINRQFYTVFKLKQISLVISQYSKLKKENKNTLILEKEREFKEIITFREILLTPAVNFKTKLKVLLWKIKK